MIEPEVGCLVEYNDPVGGGRRIGLLTHRGRIHARVADLGAGRLADHQIPVEALLGQYPQSDQRLMGWLRIFQARAKDYGATDRTHAAVRAAIVSIKEREKSA
jgi:hypothetical protein